MQYNCQVYYPDKQYSHMKFDVGRRQLLHNCQVTIEGCCQVADCLALVATIVLYGSVLQSRVMWTKFDMMKSMSSYYNIMIWYCSFLAIAS